MLSIVFDNIILSKDVCINLVNSNPINRAYDSYDDCLISDILQSLNYSLQNITEYKLEYLISDKDNIIPDNIDDILYFRIKNADRNIDIEMFKILYDRIYSEPSLIE